jgi:hypothetical protein
MAQGLGYTVDLVPTAFTNVSSTIFQLTAGATNPYAIHRIELQSNQTGSTQAILQVQAVIASGTGSGGTTVSPTPRAIIRKNTVSAATAAVCGYTTPGAVSLVLHTWQWNGATPFDIVLGKDIMVWEIPATQIFALNFLTAPGTPTISGSVTIEEF